MTHYVTLGVLPAASAEQVKAAWRSIAWECHPDRTTDKEKHDAYLAAVEAYAVLGNEKKRLNYNTTIELKVNKCARCGGYGMIAKQKGWTAAVPQRCPACQK